MEAIGLEPGGEDGSYLEPFPIYGWEDLGSSATVVSPVTRSIPIAQAYKLAGTGPEGITASIVDVGAGLWEDFERVDVEGKIVLFDRANPMFYGMPTLAEAAARGAVGALMDYPIIAKDALKNDVIHGSIPAAYLREVDARWIRRQLAGGEDVVVDLVVDNLVGHAPTAHNVIGVIPGTTYPDELVYLSAHFDHWFTSAADDNAGIGSLLAVAKAIVDSGLRPARTLVFVAFDSEELGGPPDTWYDWCLGSYSHIVQTLDGRTLHPERPGRIAAMLNMDVIAAEGTVVFVETTPDITSFIATAAEDSGLLDAAPAYVYWPPSSYDDWPFYMAGVPVMQIAWWGSAYDRLYHTTDDTMDRLDPAYLHANMAFNGLAMIRMAQAEILPYTLSENLAVAEAGIANLLEKAPRATGPGRADITPLERGMERYRATLASFEPRLAQELTYAQVVRANRAMLASAVALNPHLFDWDTSVIPGWTGLFLFDTYAHDLDRLDRAIADLREGRTYAASRDLARVTTMKWGRYVGAEAYAEVLSSIAFPEHPLWAEGHLPNLTDVHTEYMALVGRTDEPVDATVVLASLIAKRDAIYTSITEAAREAGSAFREAAGVLREAEA
jgi:Iap family predicted aminopeptidase